MAMGNGHPIDYQRATGGDQDIARMKITVAYGPPVR
jgi:hypothetical protein